MDSKDLKYIFKKNMAQEKNQYPQKLITSTLGLHTNFLKNSIINYKTTLPKGKKRRVIHVLRKDKSEIAIITEVAYPTNAQIGKWLVNDKFKTEKHLQNFNISTPNSQIYDNKDLSLAKIETFKKSNQNVVIKPLISTQSKGVILNVSEDTFEQSWKQSLLEGNVSKGKMLVQNYIEGFEARATIIHGQLVSIMLRIPPYIIGDGKNSVQKLIENKNIAREKCGYMKKLPIKLNNTIINFLNSQNISVNYVPSQGEYVLLSSISNVSAGGAELMNITNLVSKNIKELPLKALATIPGLYTGGVDIMMKSFEDVNPIILEINSFPGLSNATYPTYGAGTNPSKIYYESLVTIDQYTNKTKNKYNFKDELDYLSDYLSYIQLKQEMLKKNYRSLISIL
ncbi:ATP-grasp domain-containing protein [Salinicoccus sp. YB14-2]|uniref:ATP-grasp domain-containing protein n=1 Tax=Salinicoccus sp. YB14-2 TaxID=1572701 RepID=UPI00069022E1|nr:ATP-grasp domain-containing protein [Salinicoccus sp. YB14-2]